MDIVELTVTRSRGENVFLMCELIASGSRLNNIYFKYIPYITSIYYSKNKLTCEF